MDLQNHWDATQARFGIAVGVREYAYIASRDATLSNAVRAFLAATLPAAAIAHVTVLSAVSSLLWPRANEVRQRVLQSYNPFRQARSTDPAIVRHLLLSRTISTVAFGDPAWETLLATKFEGQGMARLTADAGETGEFRAALVRLAATPVSVGVLQFYPAIERIERADGRILATLTLREQV